MGEHFKGRKTVEAYPADWPYPREKEAEREWDEIPPDTPWSLLPLGVALSIRYSLFRRRLAAKGTEHASG